MSDAEMQEEELEVEWNNILMILMDTIMIMIMIMIMMEIMLMITKSFHLILDSLGGGE